MRRTVLLVLLVLAVVCAPFIVAGPELEAWSAARLDAARDHRLAAAIVIVGLLVADVLLPIPSSIISIASGGVLGFAWGTVASTLGMSLACVTGYGLGRWATPRARRLVGDRDATSLASTFARHGDWIVIASRAVPVLAESSTILAGIARMPVTPFALFTSLANIGISAVYASVGAHAADARSLLPAVAGTLLAAGPLVWLRATDRGRRLASTINESREPRRT